MDIYLQAGSESKCGLCGQVFTLRSSAREYSTIEMADGDYELICDDCEEYELFAATA